MQHVPDRTFSLLFGEQLVKLGQWWVGVDFLCALRGWVLEVVAFVDVVAGVLGHGYQDGIPGDGGVSILLERA